MSPRGSQCPVDILGLRNQVRTVLSAAVNSGRNRSLARAQKPPGSATLQRPLGLVGYPVLDTKS